jgi:MoxR-like ATPase
MPPEAVIGAANRFVAFFRELQETFIERDDLLKQIALALLAREHLLMTGPPGTAKSKLAQAVLGRILCEQTHQPSVFSRQFTESTVQTDLVGPINFKTLMETGRTEHFTDEGMLGATHAFLDEVFDGRDMLLRSTLNLLNERELKQGNRISRGKIECAVMTSNRYLVEVLSSERLVAFVDRIAFLNFVPKGFASPEALAEVLRRQVASGATHPARAPLTIQDLDVLQEVVDGVGVSQALCTSVAALARSFEGALAEARRADPSFVSSRYISTRGVVRLAQLLRAICFYDWAFHDRDRPLEAQHDDLAGLRMGLTLCGPGLADVDKLLLDEPDPRERRQLAIVRTERTIFERCFTELPIIEEPVLSLEISVEFGSGTAVALAARSSVGLLDRARALAAAGARHELPAEEAAKQLAVTLEELVGRALRAGVSPGDNDQRDPLAVIAELGKLADDIDQVSPAHRQVTRWLRGKALALAGQVAAVGPSPFAAGEHHDKAAAGDLEAMKAIAETQLARIERLASLRAALRHAGAAEPEGQDSVWTTASAQTAERLWPELAAAFAAAGGGAAQRAPNANLSYLLEAIEPALDIVRQAAARLDALGADGRSLFARVVAGPLEPLVQHAFETLESDDTPRSVVNASLGENLARLADAGLLPLIPPQRLARWSAEALLRTDRRKPFRFRDRGATPAYGHYRKMRKAMPNATLAYSLVELLSAFPGVRDAADPDGALGRIAELVRTFPDDLRAQLATRDLEYVEAPIAFLESWWTELVKALPREPARALELLRTTEFFSVTHDECALARFEQEARLVALVFEGAEVAPLLARTAALTGATNELVGQLSMRRLDGPARAAAE